MGAVENARIILEWACGIMRRRRRLGCIMTPIYSFRCKCHLCDNWFEIQTDPKVRLLTCRPLWYLYSLELVSQDTRYVVTEGARQKVEEWDPAENGGHPSIGD